jgi:hypothetical protein
MEENQNNPEIQKPVMNATSDKRNWTSYFKEFLMLFLAVFAGFMAENYRDKLTEEAWAEELAINLYEELKADSAIVVIKTENRIKQEKALQELMHYFEDSSLTEVSKKFSVNFLYGIAYRTPSLFEPRTVILEQLQNSGSLRYFKNRELQKLIGDLSVAINNINDRQRLETDIRKEYINPLLVLHYDYDFHRMLIKDSVTSITVVAAYEASDEIIPFEFKSLERFDKQGTINALGIYGMNGLASTRSVHFHAYKDVNTKLLQLLRKEYKIED